MRRATQAFMRCREGAAILEFALVLPILLLLVGACVEIGRALLIHQAMTEAVGSGARALARLPGAGCGPRCAGVVEAARAAIVARGAPAERVRVVPVETPGSVALRAEVALVPDVFPGFAPGGPLTLRAVHQEVRVGE